MRAAKSYTVVYERDEDGWWVASVKGLRGCHTQGRTIDQARERTREAIQACLDLSKPYSGSLVDNVKLPAQVRRVVDMAVDARKVAAKAEKDASEGSRRAVTKLLDMGLSLRDAGELIGVSRQRAQKLAG